MLKVIPNLQLFLFLIFLSLLIFAADYFKILSLPKTAGYFLTNPISFGLYATKQNIGKQFQFIGNARFAAQQNEALRAQMADLLSENSRLRRSLAEANAQVAQSQALPPKTYKLTPARPIGLNRFLLIDKGSNDGIKTGQAVIFKDVLLGFVDGTSEKGAQIKLLTDPDSKLSAFSQNLNGQAKGVLLGQFGQGLLLDKILHQEPIQKEDLVFSQGVELGVPRGLVLGRVTEVENGQSQLFKQAKVDAVYSVSDLDLVFVITE